MENSGRVEDVTWDGNDFRQNFNNGVCIANRGDFTRSTVTNNKFHNNGFGEPIAPAVRRLRAGALRRRLRGLPRFHRGEPGLRCSARALTASASRTSPSPGTTTARTAGSTSSSILMVAVNGGTYFGFGFCVFLRTERQEISRISFTDEVCKKNRLGGYRLETDTDSTHSALRRHPRDHLDQRPGHREPAAIPPRAASA
jgi:hypothetical protein